MGIGWPQILIIVVLLVLLFGRGKISGLMGDVAQGIKSFKKGIADDEPEEEEAPKNLEKKSETVVSEEKSEKSDSAS